MKRQTNKKPRQVLTKAMTKYPTEQLSVTSHIQLPLVAEHSITLYKQTEAKFLIYRYMQTLKPNYWATTNSTLLAINNALPRQC